MAFVTGIIWVTLKSTGEEHIDSLCWVIGINMALFLVSMGFVLIRQLKIADSAASHVWTSVKADPKKAYLPALGFVGVVVLVLGSLLSKILRVLTGPRTSHYPRLNRAIPKISLRKHQCFPAATHSAPAPKTPTPQTEAKPSWYPAERTGPVRRRGRDGWFAGRVIAGRESIPATPL